MHPSGGAGSGIRGILHVGSTPRRGRSRRTGTRTRPSRRRRTRPGPARIRWPPIQERDRGRVEEHLDRRIHHGNCEHHLGRPFANQSRHSPSAVALLPWVVAPLKPQRGNPRMRRCVSLVWRSGLREHTRVRHRTLGNDGSDRSHELELAARVGSWWRHGQGSRRRSRCLRARCQHPGSTRRRRAGRARRRGRGNGGGDDS
jgi:hypothetical protein